MIYERNIDFLMREGGRERQRERENNQKDI